MFGARAASTFQDTVTFKRPTNAKDPVGGLTTTYAATTPSAIPCKYEALTGSQREVGNKLIANSDYMIKIPAWYSSALIDVDGACQAVIAARSGGEIARTFNVNWVGRMEGFEIEVYVSIES